MDLETLEHALAGISLFEALRIDGVARAVLSLSGPERLAGEWWSDPFDRDYYRVRLEGLGEAWVYRDGRDGRLWLHGLFD